jgi:hypothetical protein
MLQCVHKSHNWTYKGSCLVRGAFGSLTTATFNHAHKNNTAVTGISIGFYAVPARNSSRWLMLPLSNSSSMYPAIPLPTPGSFMALFLSSIAKVHSRIAFAAFENTPIVCRKQLTNSRAPYCRQTGCFNGMYLPPLRMSLFLK